MVYSYNWFLLNNKVWEIANIHKVTDKLQKRYSGYKKLDTNEYTGFYLWGYGIGNTKLTEILIVIRGWG